MKLNTHLYMTQYLLKRIRNFMFTKRLAHVQSSFIGNKAGNNKTEGQTDIDQQVARWNKSWSTIA
jgi:hypothetical protein